MSIENTSTASINFTILNHSITRSYLNFNNEVDLSVNLLQWMMPPMPEVSESTAMRTQLISAHGMK
ncbi:hypothetical protein GYMLUDRAFT_45170 [Collybiopsis luxurians FD-317 M1]|uniref:Uncharacterized protein n=1 Tax=Collybiopsis luxurians FD-317 M1 TaxID=944289 RepID=A0A0D0CSB5_9AGAR|nr:hypothetical protein GYMLUDRAFT_45170 [Collybiopsis luxurians FD-317 M1]